MDQNEQNQIPQTTPTEMPVIEPAAKQGWWERRTGEKLTKGEKIWSIVFFILFLFVFYVTLDANKYQALVQVVEGEGRVGVNPTDEKLDFGDLSRGTAAVRTVTIKNDTYVPFFVSVIKLGGISSLIKIDENNFMVRRGEEKKIEFATYMPASAEIGKKYTGRVYVFKIPAPGF
ncbi:MAG: hypothetical protein A3C84_03010 [Candidatus Ryanbacteria bacterium RIFCSPHIGHO2_02_FULL_48_12]|uniref:Uncharacterized protein n=1 Tax=Candidatus Ryanbacteria bacterium RIFCSPHIGHO2_01_FULL_48_27 TaxID=1802115 RepID=A0A1G2G4T9_9BACT|nr:MAG: hypothetical protein A2756_01480 [Candidatus Ryanbacteria bacterium RIFCSPHIGHO2_01_FULL_48_27]OGZ49070.1 MAG: hypothetical protein A3C84_03010 [Candidatus Ryanbacteria bacterium RIFCSPHIGHO2_02_FULL_48_12]